MPPTKVPTPAQIDRALGRRSLHAFVCAAWPIVYPAIPFVDGPLLRVLCEILESVTRGERKRVILNVPPGHMKSSLTCIFWPVWEWLTQPSLRQTFVSYDQKLVLRDSEHVLNLIESAWFRARFPEVWVPGGAATGLYSNTRGGLRFSTSVGGALTGHHMERLVIDDPIKPSEVDGKKLAACETWYRGTVVPRINDRLAMVVIMQRLHQKDLCGILLDEPGWEGFRFPAFYEPAQADDLDWRTEPEEILWPALHPESVLREKARGLGPLRAAAQLQQRPAPAGGALFKEEQIVYFDDLPSQDVYGAEPVDVVLSWDLTFKDEVNSDYVCGMAVARVGALYYVLEVVRERLDFVGAVDAILALSGRYPGASAVLVEDKANGPAVISTLRNVVPGLVPVKPMGSKVARAHAVTGLFAARQVHFRRGAAWVPALLSELLAFPTGAHDDQVDALTQALNHFRDSVSDFERIMALAMKQKKEGGAG